jgi:hypothetical protein
MQQTLSTPASSGRLVRFAVAIAAVAVGVTAAALASKPGAPEAVVAAPASPPTAAPYETMATLLASRAAGLSDIVAALPVHDVALASDEERRRSAAAMLRRAAFELNSARERACQSGLASDQACAPAFAPAWLGEPARFAPPSEELERRAKQLAGEVAGVAGLVCRTQAARGAAACAL